MKQIVILLVTLSLGACVQPPKPLRGEFSSVSPAQIQESKQLNQLIRWTGFVVEVENQENKSCLVIVSKVPDAMSKPSRRYRIDQGRFIACKKTFLEPEFFIDKAVTVTGVVKEIIEKNIGEHPYSYPVVDTKVIYAW